LLQVADAGVIKAGHTGWNQAGVVVQNIMCTLAPDYLDPTTEELNRDGKKEFKLTEYEKSPPQIKVTLGLVRSHFPSPALKLFPLQPTKLSALLTKRRSLTRFVLYFRQQRHSVSELLPSMDAKETQIKISDEGKVDGHYDAIWRNMGADPSDLDA